MSNQPPAKFVTVLVPPVYDLGGRPFYYDKNGEPTRRRPATAFKGRPAINWKSSATALLTKHSGQSAAAARAKLIKILVNVAKGAGVTIESAVEPGIRLVRDGVAALFGGMPVRRNKMVSDTVINYHAAQIIAAVTLLRTWHHAWMDSPLPVKATDALDVRLGVNPRGITQQLRSLLLAASHGRDARLEVQWHQTTPAARFVLKRSLDRVDDATLLALVAKIPASGDILSTPIPSRHFLKATLPHVIDVSSKRHGTVYDREEELLLTCRQAFLAVNGGHRDFMTVGCIPFPHGKGADFVRAVEQLFDIAILPRNSRKMIQRVRATTKRRRFRW
jgi:hypothetical protein